MLDEFFPNADFAFGVLGTELWSRHGRRSGRPCGGSAQRRRGLRGRLLVSARDWLETTFASERAHGVLAPWVLHTGLGPDAAASGYMAQVIAVAVQEGGMPIPRGGGAKLADALVAYIRATAAVREPACTSSRVFARSASHTAAGEDHRAPRGICNVTPTQLYGRLLDGTARRPTLPLRPVGDADPLRALRAAEVGGRRAARPRRRSCT